MAFDKEGHLRITPAVLLDAASNRRTRLVNDVLCQGTPAFFRTYSDYRDFLHLAADKLEVSPFSIWIRGSAHIGFSIAPRPNKVWMEVGEDSDLDLAIVDPDHYHLFDVEIRRWERDSGTSEPSRVKRLRIGRSYYQYKHHDLPPTPPACKDYKLRVDELRSVIGKKVTAFFYRDYWALHERYLKDVRDLLFQNRIGLPTARHAPFPRGWLTDDDLGPWWFPNPSQTELNLSQKKLLPPSGITDTGLAHLGTLGKIERLWLDGCDVTDVGIKLLNLSANLRLISLAYTRVTDACLNTLNQLFPNLQTLILDSTDTTEASVKQFCSHSVLTTLSVRKCKWSKTRNINFLNTYGSRIRTVS